MTNPGVSEVHLSQPPERPSAFGGEQLIRPDVLRIRLPLSNAFLLGHPGEPWVLVDAGTPGSASMILSAVERRFGPGAVPEAIVLTHGHLDHIGGLFALRRHWPEVPIFAHSLELPYLTGRSAYPPPDPSVGGSMSVVSPLFVPGPFDFRPQVQPFPEVSALKALTGWTVIPTPGHAPGHVSLWRGSDRVLIAGDAFVTTVQESALSALSLRPRVVHRPPAYYTPDWDAARDSVKRLAALAPDLALTGHGDPVAGEELRTTLQALALNFDQSARPKKGRYIRQPAVTDASGVVSLPPLGASMLRPAILVTGLLALWFLRRRGRNHRTATLRD